MGLGDAFINGVETVFNVLNEAVKDAEYVTIIDNGWGTTSSESYSVRVILDNFTQEDLKSSTFSDLIQHTDTKGLVPGKDFADNFVDVNTTHHIEVDGRSFEIVAYETDPFNVLYTLLLRDST